MEVHVFLHLGHVLLVYILPLLECHLIAWVGGHWLHQVSKILSVHSCCEVCCVLCVYYTDIGTDFSCCLYVMLRCSFPCPIVDVAVESWLMPLELGLPSALQVSSLVPLSTLVPAMTSLVLPSPGTLLSLARAIAFTFIRHGNSRTSKIMLRTTNHVWREPVSTPIISFYKLFNFKSLRLDVTCSRLVQNTHVIIGMLGSRHQRAVAWPLTSTSW